MIILLKVHVPSNEHMLMNCTPKQTNFSMSSIIGTGLFGNDDVCLRHLLMMMRSSLITSRVISSVMKQWWNCDEDPRSMVHLVKGARPLVWGRVDDDDHLYLKMMMTTDPWSIFFKGAQWGSLNYKSLSRKQANCFFGTDQPKERQLCWWVARPIGGVPMVRVDEYPRWWTS